MKILNKLLHRQQDNKHINNFLQQKYKNKQKRTKTKEMPNKIFQIFKINCKIQF